VLFYAAYQESEKTLTNPANHAKCRDYTTPRNQANYSRHSVVITPSSVVLHKAFGFSHSGYWLSAVLVGVAVGFAAKDYLP